VVSVFLNTYTNEQTADGKKTVAGTQGGHGGGGRRRRCTRFKNIGTTPSHAIRNRVEVSELPAKIRSMTTDPATVMERIL